MYHKVSVTVIIPYKDNLKYLFSALNSVFKQTFKGYKILIIYDNENTSDLEKIKKFIKEKIYNKNTRIKILVNHINLGAGPSRNKGIKKTKTRYIAFLDSDDLWSKKKLETQIKFMENGGYEISHTSYYVINNKNQITSIRKARKSISFQDLLKSCDIGLSTVMVKTKFLQNNNFCFPQIKTKEDFILWLKILKKIKYIFSVNKNLTYYRKTKNSLSSNKIVSVLNGYKVYKNYMKFSKIKSLYYLLLLSINSINKNFLN